MQNNFPVKYFRIYNIFQIYFGSHSAAFYGNALFLFRGHPFLLFFPSVHCAVQYFIEFCPFKRFDKIMKSIDVKCQCLGSHIKYPGGTLGG